MGLSNLWPLLLIFSIRLDSLIRWERTASRSFLFPCKKIGTVAASLFYGCGTAPFRHFRVIPADKNLRNFPATVFGRAREVWKIQQHILHRPMFARGPHGILRRQGQTRIE